MISTPTLPAWDIIFGKNQSKCVAETQGIPAFNVIICGQNEKCNFSSIPSILNVKEKVLDNDMDVKNVLMKYPNEKEKIFSSMKRAISQNAQWRNDPPVKKNKTFFQNLKF